MSADDNKSMQNYPACKESTLEEIHVLELLRKGFMAAFNAHFQTLTGH